MPYCGKCGLQVGANWRFCSRCGFPLDASLLMSREKEQAELELRKEIKAELVLWGGRWLYYVFFVLTAVYAVVLSLLFDSYFLTFKFRVDSVFLVDIWSFLILISLFLVSAAQFKYIVTVHENLKKNVVPAARSLLIYFGKIYKFTYYQAVFILASALALTSVWLIEVAVGYLRWNIFATAFFAILVGFGVGFLLFAPNLISYRIGNRKITVQKLLNKIEGS